jgi:hypothetical protein
MSRLVCRALYHVGLFLLGLAVSVVFGLLAVVAWWLAVQTL